MVNLTFPRTNIPFGSESKVSFFQENSAASSGTGRRRRRANSFILAAAAVISSLNPCCWLQLCLQALLEGQGAWIICGGVEEKVEEACNPSLQLLLVLNPLKRNGPKRSGRLQRGAAAPPPAVAEAGTAAARPDPPASSSLRQTWLL